MNVLSQFVYSALASQGVTSSAGTGGSLHPVHHTRSRTSSTSPSCKGLIDDPHFVTRDRMGRDLAFHVQVYTNGWSNLLLATSPSTSRRRLLLDAKGNGTVVGNSTVYFLQAPGAPQACQPGVPLTYQNIAVYRINSTGTFNLPNWRGNGGTAYTVSANAGVVTSTQSGGAIY